MKKYVIFLVIFLTSCAGWMGSSMPPPEAGSVGVINPNIGVYADCRLFPDQWPEDKLIINDRQGNQKFAVPSIANFTVKSAITDYEVYAQFLKLPYPASFTLYVLWTRFTGERINQSVITFRTTGHPCNDKYVDRYGWETCADKFIRLPAINTNQNQMHFRAPF